MKVGTNMTIHMLWKMIAQNFKMQRHVIMPFILALSIMFATEFILLSLNMNDYVQKRSQLLPIFIGVGNFFMSVLGFIFILYANRFMMKRRQQELCDEHDTRNGEETFPDDYAHRDGISICFNCAYQYNWWLSLWRINLYAYE